MTAALWHSLLQNDRPSALVLWLQDSDLEFLASRRELPPVFLSQSLLPSPSVPRFAAEGVYLTYPFALPEEFSPESKRVKGWLFSRRVARRHDAVQLNAYFVMSLLDCSLARMVDHFSRDYLIETIEHETETSVNPGVFPRLSLGPGQRFASKGAYVVKLASDGTVQAVSDWIVP
jgi:hypothetical protein